MNWLAHLYLSEPTAEFRIGNLLPDIIRIGDLAEVPAPFLPGVICHRKIDTYTDSHPVVAQSKARIGAPFTKFSGVLVDVFYDHVLARNWARFSSISLVPFAEEVYNSFDRFHDSLPPLANERLALMKKHQWISAYDRLDGIALALQRMSRRLRRPLDLGDSVEILAEKYDEFSADFELFFPDLVAHVNLPHNLSPS
ncbi:MAG: ACP phosphodiesterase [Puniceicoccales bacterium]|jgi:acyl carrier protein phosphodiesterase|nr:ACP phosphodiesterase [Puniceicoccales bacterium]